MRSSEVRCPGPLELRPVSVRVLDPETPLPAVELDRLFGTRLPSDRRQPLVRCPRIVASCGDRIVGVAAYENLAGETRVLEFGVDDQAPGGTLGVANAVLDALELGCVARGAYRLVLSSRASAVGPVLWQRGYSRVGGGAGGWLKTLL